MPGDLLTDLEVYRLITLALGLLFATLLFRRWVSGWAALLGAILLLATVRLDQKFDGYRPETVALVLALFTLWVADRAFVERSPRAIVGRARRLRRWSSSATPRCSSSSRRPWSGSRSPGR